MPFNLISSDFARTEAVRRERLHAQAGDYRAPIGDITGEEANFRGLCAEKKFGELLGLPVRCLERPGGDNGWEFLLRLATPRGVESFLVDVKAASKPRWLTCNAAKTRPRTIYVLAKYHPRIEDAELLGWEWGVVLLQSKPIKLTTKENAPWMHWVERARLRDLGELIERQR